MTTTVEDGTVCVMCNRTYAWHREHSPRHPFTTSEGPLKPPKDDIVATPEVVSGRGIQQTSMPFDPVLRMALIDAGVISTHQLDVAENKIRLLTGGLADGQG